MKTVFEAVYSRFTGSELDAAIEGRLYPMQAPVGTSAPLVISTITSETSTYGFTSSFITALVELSVYATDPVAMNAIADKVFSLYDDCKLSGLVGYDQVGPMSRDFATPLIVENVYRYIIEYRLNLQKQG